MATANGADFSTQCYRHGVLIGNWNEDQYGCDLMTFNSSSAALPPSSSPPARLYYPETTTHATFSSAGHDIIRRSVFESKTQARMSAEVDKSLLFAHKGAEPLDRRYQTSYLQSYGSNIPSSNSNATSTSGNPVPAQPSVSQTIAKSMKQYLAQSQQFGGEMLGEDENQQSRFRSYRTAHADAFHAKNSILALQGQKPIAGAGGGATLKADANNPLLGASGTNKAQIGARRGQLVKSLEQNYRKIGLRK